MSFWTVPPEWAGETVFILGGGPSLSAVNIGWLEGQRVIAINNAYQVAPSSDVLYFCDFRWWTLHRPRVLESFVGKHIITIAPEVNGDCRVLRNSGALGFDDDPGALRHGSNSGYQAIHLAAHFGAKQIVLLGYDMKVKAGRTHWHKGHPDTGSPDGFAATLRQTLLPPFQYLVEPLRKRGIKVINATPDSALKCWPYRHLRDVLADLEAVCPECGFRTSKADVMQAHACQ